MRVLVTSQPAHGHFHPVIPLARALGAAGHEVRVATAAAFRPHVEAAGLVHMSAGIDWLGRTALDQYPENVTGGVRWTLHDFFCDVAARALASDLARLTVSWRPDVVLRETWELGGAVAAQALGVPCAVFGVGRWKNMEEVVEVGRPERLLGKAGENPAALAGELYLDSCPPFLDLPTGHPRAAHSVPIRPEIFDATVATPDLAWLAEPRTRPLLHVGLGTVMARWPGILEGLLASAAQLDVDVVATTGPGRYLRSLPPQPPQIRVERYVPLSALLPHCTAVVSHAGWGTTVATLTHGLPLVSVPIGWDGFDNAAATEAAGVSLTVSGADAATGNATGAIERLLADDDLHRNAEEARDAIARMPSAAAAVPAIEALV